MVKSRSRLVGATRVPCAKQSDRPLSVQQIGEGLMARTLPHHLWTHEAHLAAALYLLMDRVDVDASKVMPELIRRYNEDNNIENSDNSGFHATITELYLRAIRFFLHRTPENTTADQAFESLCRSPIGDRAFPLNFYSPEVLFSKRARHQWLEPEFRDLTEFYLAV